MKIAYLSFEFPDGTSGVSRKIKAQSDQWRRQGHDAKYFILKAGGKQNPDIVFVAKKFIKNPTVNLTFNLKALAQALQEYNPDIIYMRETLYVPGLIKTLSIAPYIVEINSNARQEYFLASFFKGISYFLTGDILIKNADGIVFISDELKQKVKPVKQRLETVIANGYNYSDVRIAPPLKKKTVDFIFVGSPNQPWNGLDELGKLAAVLPEYRFHVVMEGYTPPHENIIAYGALYGESLKSLYQHMDIGIGTLALYRKEMKEASPLKTREYIAHGLPTILPYIDSDLNNHEAKDGILKIENKPDACVNAKDEIDAFAKDWAGRRLSQDKTAALLSYEVKEQKRLEFFKQVRNFTGEQ